MAGFIEARLPAPLIWPWTNQQQSMLPKGNTKHGAYSPIDMSTLS